MPIKIALIDSHTPYSLMAVTPRNLEILPQFCLTHTEANPLSLQIITSCDRHASMYE